MWCMHGVYNERLQRKIELRRLKHYEVAVDSNRLNHVEPYLLMTDTCNFASWDHTKVALLRF